MPGSDFDRRILFFNWSICRIEFRFWIYGQVRQAGWKGIIISRELWQGGKYVRRCRTSQTMGDLGSDDASFFWSRTERNEKCRFYLLRAYDDEMKHATLYSILPCST